MYQMGTNSNFMMVDEEPGPSPSHASRSNSRHASIVSTVEFPPSADPFADSTAISSAAAVRPLQLPLVTDPNPPPGALRVVCISDTHGYHGSVNVPKGDILIHAGDFTQTGEVEEIAQFNYWMCWMPHKYKIVIAGNHDITLHADYYRRNWRRFHPKPYDSAAARRALKSVIYLEDSGVTIEGLNIYGTPWSPNFCDWAFNLPRGAACRSKWDRIPADTDILISHGPPYGHGDLAFDAQTGGNRNGCVDLLHTVQRRVRPRYHIFGHVHEGYGATTDGFTKYLNASSCTMNYRPTNPPIVFDIMPPQEQSMEDDGSTPGSPMSNYGHWARAFSYP